MTFLGLVDSCFFLDGWMVGSWFQALNVIFIIFDKTSLSAKAGKNIRLTLNHTGKIGKEFMGHNFVLLKKDVDVDDFAMLALDFKENEYIPENNDFIVHTKMLGGGESDTINFTIEEPGSYTYVCTFPGHYQIMQGILTIE